jgi:hypothetical protein
VVGEDLQVSLAFEAFGNNPDLWGQLLAQIAAHVADATNSEGYGERDSIFGKIRGSLIENMENPFAGLQRTVRGPLQ